MDQTRASPKSDAQLNSTLTELLKSKTVGFFAGYCLLINAMTGPSIPFVSALFFQSGYIPPVIVFMLFGVLATMSSLFIVEAMQAIPGNKHFQGTVEFATLVNFYFGSKMHLAAQFSLYGALQSNAIQSMILTAQAFDNIILEIVGKTCGVTFNNPVFICVSDASADASPFGSVNMLFTAGMLVVILFTVPFLFLNIGENILLQIGLILFLIILVTSMLSLLVLLQWCVAAFLAAPMVDPSLLTPIPVFSQNGIDVIVGTIMLGIAHTYVVPSWINVKKRTVDIQTTLWSASISAIAAYLIIGLVLSSHLPNSVDNNILPILIQYGVPKLLTKIMVYGFSIVMLLPSIPVTLIVSRDNLLQNEIFNKPVSAFVSYVIPWIITAILGPSIFVFQNWTSLIFVSTSNFIVPLCIYLKCNEFRKKYNKNRRVLTKKQHHLLKKIHFQSIAINKWVDNQKALNKHLSLRTKKEARLGKHEKGEVSINGVLAKINLEGAPSRKLEKSFSRENPSFLTIPHIRRGSASIKDPKFVLLLGGYEPYPGSRGISNNHHGMGNDIPLIQHAGDACRRRMTDTSVVFPNSIVMDADHSSYKASSNFSETKLQLPLLSRYNSIRRNDRSLRSDQPLRINTVTSSTSQSFCNLRATDKQESLLTSHPMTLENFAGNIASPHNPQSALLDNPSSRGFSAQPVTKASSINLQVVNFERFELSDLKYGSFRDDHKPFPNELFAESQTHAKSKSGISNPGQQQEQAIVAKGTVHSSCTSLLSNSRNHISVESIGGSNCSCANPVLNDKDTRLQGQRATGDAQILDDLNSDVVMEKSAVLERTISNLQELQVINSDCESSDHSIPKQFQDSSHKAIRHANTGNAGDCIVHLRRDYLKDTILPPTLIIRSEGVGSAHAPPGLISQAMKRLLVEIPRIGIFKKEAEGESSSALRGNFDETDPFNPEILNAASRRLFRGPAQSQNAFLNGARSFASEKLFKENSNAATPFSETRKDTSISGIGSWFSKSHNKSLHTMHDRSAQSKYSNNDLPHILVSEYQSPEPPMLLFSQASSHQVNIPINDPACTSNLKGSTSASGNKFEEIDETLDDLLFENVPDPDEEDDHQSIINSRRKIKLKSFFGGSAEDIPRLSTRAGSVEFKVEEPFCLPTIIVTPPKAPDVNEDDSDCDDDENVWDLKSINKHHQTGDTNALYSEKGFVSRNGDQIKARDYRRMSLPVETLFITTITFRSLPRWLTKIASAKKIALCCLLATSGFTVLNIVVNIMSI